MQTSLHVKTYDSSSCYVLYVIVANIANFFIGMFWLWAFQQLNWLTFSADKPLWQNLAIASAIAWVIFVVLAIFYSIFIFATCGVGCVTLPFYMLAVGFLVLIGVEKITHLFTFNPANDFWIFLAMSLAFGWLKLPDIASLRQDG